MANSELDIQPSSPSNCNSCCSEKVPPTTEEERPSAGYVAAAPVVVATPMMGNCPVCHMGVLHPGYDQTCLLICIVVAILFFPLGLIALCFIRKGMTCGSCNYFM